MGTKACIAVLLVSILSLAAPGATIQQKTWADMDAWNADMLSGWLAIGVPYMRIWVWSFGEQTYNGKDVDGVWLDAAEMSVRFSKAGGTAGIIYHDRSFPTLRPNLDSTSTDSIRIDFSTPLAGYAMVIDSAQQVEIRLIDPNGDILQDWQVQPSTDVFWGFQSDEYCISAMLVTESSDSQSWAISNSMGFAIVPEPVTLCLLSLGGLVLIRRRK